MIRVSRFEQVLEALPRKVFEEAVDRHQGNKYRETFRCWDQFAAMSFAQLNASESLRKLEEAFNTAPEARETLGTGWLKRSTLADANRRVKLPIFHELVQSLMASTHRHLRQEVRDILYLLDSTSISLTVRKMQQWTEANRIRGTQGLKVHILAPCTADTITIDQLHITPPNVNDVSVAQHLPLASDRNYVFDKGYCDYNWWFRIHQMGSTFVTRFKANAGVKVIESRSIPVADQGHILADEIVTFRHHRPRGKHCNHYYGTSLRRITIHRPDHPKAKPLIIATNDLDTSAKTIADYYRIRWAIEMLFKWIKQHLLIKRYLGENENAVRFQILIAIIVYLLLITLKQTHGLTRPLYLMLESIRTTLWNCDDLIAALQPPAKRYPRTPKSQPRPKSKSASPTTTELPQAA